MLNLSDHKPTEYEDDYWISVSAGNRHEFPYWPKALGKWMIFVNKNSVDQVWELIKQETKNNKLGVSSKVSTRLGWKKFGQKDDYVICCHSYSCKDEEDILRIRTELKNLGFTQTLKYKTDYATSEGLESFLYEI